MEIKDSSFNYTGPVLVTHWGLSGPVVLKASSWAARCLHDKEYRLDVKVNGVYPETEQTVQLVLEKLRNDNARKQVSKQHWFAYIPARLWNKFLELASINPSCRWAELSNQDIHKLTQQLVNGTYNIRGKTTYKEEFVTTGGIAPNETNFGTMENKKCPSLYFADDVLDCRAGYCWNISHRFTLPVPGRQLSILQNLHDQQFVQFAHCNQDTSVLLSPPPSTADCCSIADK